ncbi:MAG: DnaJ domain-containing protein [Candidatus Nitrosotenuis sp.]
MDTTQACLILNLKPDSSYSDVKYSYRKMALETHPDRNNSERDGKKFKLITEAYHTLKNNNKNNNTKKDNQRRHSNTETKDGKTFSRTNWGAPNKNDIPEEDWSKYTKQTEQSDPHFWQEYVAEFWKDYEATKVDQTKNPNDFEIKQEKKLNLFASVEHSLCIGCCSCEIIAPQVFHVDKISKMNPKSNVINQNGTSTDKIMDAAQTCPTKAIRIEEQETRKRLYPY